LKSSGKLVSVNAVADQRRVRKLVTDGREFFFAPFYIDIEFTCRQLTVGDGSRLCVYGVTISCAFGKDSRKGLDQVNPITAAHALNDAGKLTQSRDIKPGFGDEFFVYPAWVSISYRRGVHRVLKFCHGGD
jgi:hypothetical protein